MQCVVSVVLFATVFMSCEVKFNQLNAILVKALNKIFRGRMRRFDLDILTTLGAARN